jgi:hypothetical protein
MKRQNERSNPIGTRNGQAYLYVYAPALYCPGGARSCPLTA